MKNIYEIFDDFEIADSKQERMEVIGRNMSKALVEVLRLTFHPSFQWLVEELPDNYSPNWDNSNGFARCQLSTELRKLYMFQKGNPTAEALPKRKQKELLIQLLESLEPREAEVVLGIFQKDQHVEGLTYEFVKEAFPNMLP
jgi:hypothetical protein